MTTAYAGRRGGEDDGAWGKYLLVPSALESNVRIVYRPPISPSWASARPEAIPCTFVSVRARSAGASDGSIVRRRIGINGNLISSDPSFRSAGIATYIRRLAERLPVVDPDTDYVLFGQLATGLMVRSWGWTRRREGRIIWEQVLSPIQVRTARLGLLHSPANVAPVALGLPSVVTVHDLTFIRQPEWFHGRDRFILAPLMRLSIQRADAVIVPSASTGRDVAEHYSLPEDRIEVIPEGVDPRFSETTPVSAPVPYPYILHVGTIEAQEPSGSDRGGCPAAGPRISAPLGVGRRSRLEVRGSAHGDSKPRLGGLGRRGGLPIRLIALVSVRCGVCVSLRVRRLWAAAARGDGLWRTDGGIQRR